MSNFFCAPPQGGQGALYDNDSSFDEGSFFRLSKENSMFPIIGGRLQNDRRNRANGAAPIAHVTDQMIQNAARFEGFLAYYINEVRNHNRKFTITFPNGSMYTINDRLVEHVRKIMTDDEDNEDNADFESKKTIEEWIKGGLNGTVHVEEQLHWEPDRDNFLGAYHPFTFQHPDPYVTNECAKLGLFANVDAANYKHHCLYIALQQQGAPSNALEEFKHLFTGGHFRTQHLSAIAIKAGMWINLKYSQLKIFSQDTTSGRTLPKARTERKEDRRLRLRKHDEGALPK